MSSKTKKCNNLEEAVKGLFNFESEEEKLEFEAQQLHLSIMLKIKELMEKKEWKKTDLAKAMGVTKPFVTKLFAAEKFINIKMMAKIEQIFGIHFDVNTSEHSLIKEYQCDNIIKLDKHPKYLSKVHETQKFSEPYNPSFNPEETGRIA